MSIAKRALFLILLALVLPASAHQKRSASRARSPFTGTYRNRFGDWEILDLGKDKLKVSCSLTYPYKVRGVLTANLGECGGEATLNGKVATFKPEETSACTITLRFTGNRLVVNQDGSDADCGFGHNVYADGTYPKRSSRQPRFDVEK